MTLRKAVVINYVRILYGPAMLTVVVAAIGTTLLSTLEVSRDAAVLGLLASFDGTAASVLIAFQVARPPSLESIGDSAAYHRKKVYVRYCIIVCLVALSLTVTATHYSGAGALAVALNFVVILSLVWTVLLPDFEP